MTLKGLHSIARPSVIEWRAALAAQYSVFHGVVLCIKTEEVKEKVNFSKPDVGPFDIREKGR